MQHPMALSQWSEVRAHKDFDASLQTYQVGAHFKALNEPLIMAPSNSRYTQVGFKLLFVQVCPMNVIPRHFPPKIDK